jgi:hypothetical protein
MIDPSGFKNIVIIVGEDKKSHNNGFKSTGRTIERDHPDDDVKTLYAWEYKTAAALLEATGQSFGGKGIDKLYVECHSSPEKIYARACWQIEKCADWSCITFNKNATIRLSGCRAGGDGVADTNSIAQVIANKTQRCVYAFLCKSSQDDDGHGRYWQEPNYGGYVKFTPKPMPRKSIWHISTWFSSEYAGWTLGW